MPDKNEHKQDYPSEQLLQDESAFPFLSDILCHLERKNLLLSSTIPLEDARTCKIKGAASDSREVAEGNIFICKGSAFKAAYLQQALEKGAKAVLCGAELESLVKETLLKNALARETLAKDALSKAPLSKEELVKESRVCDEKSQAKSSRNQVKDDAKHLQEKHNKSRAPQYRKEQKCDKETIPLLVVNDIRTAMAEVSALAWSYPNHELKIVGVTGTKGKSTTTMMVKALLDAVESGSSRCAYLGTHHIFNGKETKETVNTTPEPPDLWRCLHESYINGCKYVVMEVSSQALKYQRTSGLRFTVGCFLNIGTDHISDVEHPTFCDYFQSKLRLFDQSDTVLLNFDTDHYQEIGAYLAERNIEPQTISIQETNANYYASGIETLDTIERVMQFDFHAPSFEAPITLGMSGKHNVFDAAAAIAIVDCLGIDAEKLKTAAQKVFPHMSVPGRMEIIVSSDERIVGIVDYAHNDLSFDTFFKTVKQNYPEAYIISFFGVSGGKALNRYQDLPAVASLYSDYLILTSDEPGNEDPTTLLEEMEKSVPSSVAYEKEIDREAALEKAVQRAREAIEKEGEPQVVICALGKGEEDTMDIGGRTISFEPDAKHLKRLLHSNTPLT